MVQFRYLCAIQWLSLFVQKMIQFKESLKTKLSETKHLRKTCNFYETQVCTESLENDFIFTLIKNDLIGQLKERAISKNVHRG